MKCLKENSLDLVVALSEVGEYEFRHPFVKIQSLKPFVWGSFVRFDVCEEYIGSHVGESLISESEVFS